MPVTAIWFGRLLVVVGIVGYAYGLYNGAASPTALIPAAFGILLMILGHVAAAKGSLRMHLMHAAVLVALLGFVLSAGRLAMKARELTIGAALFSQLAMAILCLLFVILAVRSFIAARRELSAEP
ncbi:MAG: hypothetical protein JO053_07105 [Acidobacteria bacterium]|nr:hypothetical protein [Acidobacteriota bacterium]